MGEIADEIIKGPEPGDLDDLEQITDCRICRNNEDKPECNNCGSTNVKTSSKGNLYCADLCWVSDEIATPPIKGKE